MTAQEVENYLVSCYEKMLERLPSNELRFEIRIHPEVATAIGWTDGQLLTEYQLPLVFDEFIPNEDGRSDIYILDPKYLTNEN